MKKMLILVPALLLFLGAGCGYADRAPVPVGQTEIPVIDIQEPIENGDDVLPTEPVDSVVCGIENCHGLEIVCGPNPAEICTMQYMLGDKCRQLASCQIIDGECTQAPSLQFDTCKECVLNCIDAHGDDIAVFDCESKC